MKDFTIVRRRVVTQISTDVIRAATEAEALDIANQEQADGTYDNSNEWHNLDDCIDYPQLDGDAVLESQDVGVDGNYIDVEKCQARGEHLKDCDEDGYCNLCGEQ